MSYLFLLCLLVYAHNAYKLIRLRNC